jgi:hypothetical protein
VGDYLSTSTTLDNIQRETGCKLSINKQEVTFAGSDFQIRAARAAVAAASSRILPPLASPVQDDDDSTIATVEKLPVIRRRPTPVKIVNALSDSPYGQTACSPSNRHSGLASGWWGDRPERHEAHDTWVKRERARKRHERRRRRRERKRAERLEKGWNRHEDPPSKEDANIKRAALGAARAAMGGPERVPHTTGFPRSGDLDGSPDLYIERRPDPDERERAILWSDPDRDARTRERLSRSPTRRAEAESMVVHSEPTKPDVYVGKRWVSHRDLPEKRRERSLSPLSRLPGKVCEPLSAHHQPAIPAPAFSGGRETTRVSNLFCH